MNLMKKIDKIKLNELIDAGYIMVNRHPELPLSILNYTRKAQFEKVWNEYTLLCRGLIIDDDYNIVARPFPKFFNIEEHQPNEIPNLPFDIYEKMDGSFGILFHYANKWHIATRGSFNSDQALRATEIMKKYNIEMLSTEATFLFEIIYPENRIVCDYGADEKLVMLGIIHVANNIEMTYELMKAHEMIGFDIVKKYDGFKDLKALQALNIENREGYIIRYSNGFRVKVKFEEYCRLHKLITNVSSRQIWESLRYNRDLNELLEKVPDEFDSWVKKTILELNEAFANIENDAHKQYRIITHQLGENFTKKDFAMNALQYKHSSILFKMLEDGNYDDYIWKQVEPEWTKPFKENVEI